MTPSPPLQKTAGALDSPEIQLLLHCCRVELADRSRLAIKQALQSVSDWDWVVSTAIEHRVDGFLLKHLAQFPTCPLPNALRQKLERRSKATAMANLKLARELIHLLQELEHHGIRAAPYKGPLLMQRVYGDIGLRATHDLDILIHPRDLERAEHIATQRGFQPLAVKTRLGRWLRPLLEKDSEWRNPDRQIYLEVHWRFAKAYYPFPLDGRSLMERLVEDKWAGHRFHAIPPEETLLILCLHGSLHHWHRFEMITMIAEFCRVHEKLDWCRVRQIARTNTAWRPLLLGLALAHRHLQAPIPTDLIDQAKAEPTVANLTRRVEAAWLSGEHQSPLMDAMQFDLSLLGSRRSRLRYLLGHLAFAALRPLMNVTSDEHPTASRPFDLARRHSLSTGRVASLLGKALHTQ